MKTFFSQITFAFVIGFSPVIFAETGNFFPPPVDSKNWQKVSVYHLLGLPVSIFRHQKNPDLFLYGQLAVASDSKKSPSTYCSELKKHYLKKDKNALVTWQSGSVFGNYCHVSFRSQASAIDQYLFFSKTSKKGPLSYYTLSSTFPAKDAPVLRQVVKRSLASVLARPK